MSDLDPTRRPQRVQDVPSSMPGFYMPAMPPLELIGAVKSWVRIYWRRRQFRRFFLPLLAHGDHLLEDLGYRREDILRASRLPLKVDARQALEEFRESRQPQRQ